ncbi:MAG TPA: HlyC/CorC family transporter [Desulfobacterales bacterium]|nr:HlyC/CorC family transporter [Desulfobacterales bacterium]
MEKPGQRSLKGFIRSLFRRRAPIANSKDLAEELQDLMDKGQAKGLITGEQKHMVHGVLELKGTTAHAIMVPRTEVSSAPLNATLGQIIDLVNKCGHTRIPIHKKNIDEIVGILHAKDLLKLWGKDPKSKLPPDILRPPFFVSEDKNINEILRELKELKTHLAIVTDDYGGTAGIITIEDILEEIVGEIMDEHDHAPPLIRPLDKDLFVVDPRLEIEKLEEALGVALPRGDYESVGGFVINLAGKLPNKGQKFTYEPLEFTVQEADHRRIQQLLIKRLETDMESAPQDHST